ncbi:MAG: hypothetical protein WDN09_04270 [bacterium]
MTTWYALDLPGDSLLVREKRLHVYRGEVVEIDYMNIDSLRNTLHPH